MMPSLSRSGSVLITSTGSLRSERRIAARAVEDVLGLRTEEQELEEDPAARSINPARRQADAYKTVQSLSRHGSWNGLQLHITGLDIYFDGYNYCFGLAFRDTAVVSVYRLRTTDVAKYIERLRKEVVHEVGHLLGLRHCVDSRCVMFFSNTVEDTDLKGVEPCKACRSRLLS